MTVNYSLSSVFIDLTCNATGEPNKYTFLSWVHESKFHDQIRHFNGTRPGILRVLRTIIITKQYQDSGFYICRVSNGITDSNGKKFQKGMASVKFEGMYYTMTI